MCGPMPFSPVQRDRKFSAVLGTTSAKSSITILPSSSPPMLMSKYTLGFGIFGREEKRVKEKCNLKLLSSIFISGPFHSSMASSGAVPFWRAAGMTYITYSNICANLVRNCLKEPHKTEALSREKVHFAMAKWADGKPEKATIRSDTPDH